MVWSADTTGRDVQAPGARRSRPFIRNRSIAASRVPSGSSMPGSSPRAGTWQTNTLTRSSRAVTPRATRALMLSPQSATADAWILRDGAGGADGVDVPTRLHPMVDLASRIAVTEAVPAMVERQDCQAGLAEALRVPVHDHRDRRREPMAHDDHRSLGPPREIEPPPQRGSVGGELDLLVWVGLQARWKLMAPRRGRGVGSSACRFLPASVALADRPPRDRTMARRNSRASVPIRGDRWLAMPTAFEPLRQRGPEMRGSAPIISLTVCPSLSQQP